MRSGTYTEIVQLCQRNQPRPVSVEDLVGEDGENLPVNRVYLRWLWLGWWLIFRSGGLLCVCSRWRRLVSLFGGRSGILGGWGWQISSGHGQG